MAHTKNIVILGLSGKFGDQVVFRQRADKTIAAKAPKAYPPPTAAQQKNRGRFQQATLYWKGLKADPELQQAYKAAAKPGQNAANVAVADFLHAPDIDEIDISGYTGLPGQLIGIKVTDDFKVKAVTLSIQNQDGTLVEQGTAMAAADGKHWIYTTTALNDSLSGDKIVISATDYPDNESSEELILQ